MKMMELVALRRQGLSIQAVLKKKAEAAPAAKPVFVSSIDADSIEEEMNFQFERARYARTLMLQVELYNRAYYRKLRVRHENKLRISRERQIRNARRHSLILA